jgi:hypothetical protein
MGAFAVCTTDIDKERALISLAAGRCSATKSKHAPPTGA